MEALAISRYGMNSGVLVTLAASPSLLRLASTISKLSMPFIGLYALSSIPGINAKPGPRMTGKNKDDDSFVECMNACDKIEAEPMKLLCYAGCAIIDIFRKK